jgi:serine/threonine protein phosphatase 1
MPQRTIAIGDVHGCVAALKAVLDAIKPTAEDTIVTLGDYVDRGPDSCGVLETLVGLEKQTNLVPLLGNHDEMMLEVCRGQTYLPAFWLHFGGDATMASYGATLPADVWPAHVEFLERCGVTFETEHFIFLHANYEEDIPIDQLPRRVLLWESIRDRTPGAHLSGKTVIVGHTSQKSGEVLDLGHLRCIDTWCYGNGWLTAMDVHSGKLWQADKSGRMRK